MKPGSIPLVRHKSLVAPSISGDGESTIYDRLVDKNAYVTSSPGKDRARRSLSNTPRKRGFWGSLFGCTIVVLCFIIVGCGPSEPSNQEIAQGMMRSFVEETGACPTDLSAKAKKIGNGRWEVKLKAYRNGEQRTLDATAVMDRNGDVHFYTD